jgi:predicted regulator of Ras-like GTPase activity (Roadblock/LC7/MglB family)
MQGNLLDMSVADLIQHICQSRRTARLTINHQEYEAELFFKDGTLVHARLGGLEGEGVVYQVLAWQEGRFNLEIGLESPLVTIKRGWSGLLLEGARLLDEKAYIDVDVDDLDRTNQEEWESVPSAKKRSELLGEALEELLVSSGDIEGAAVVGTDGLVYSANVLHHGIDQSMIGAESAAVFGLSKRSVAQLGRGAFLQTFIQGEDGNMIVASLNPETIFIGLTPKNVNLGMAFAEIRDMLARLRPLL